MKNIDVLIIGAGAAGLTAAIFAASDLDSSKSGNGAQKTTPYTDTDTDTDSGASDLVRDASTQSQGALIENQTASSQNRDASAQSQGALIENQTASSQNRDASAQNRRILVLERTNKPGKKILMSGGTRCNVLPVQMSIDDYFTDSSKNLLKRIFKSWSVEACKSWFEHDLKLSLSCEIESNKWFPTSNSAEEVRDALVDRALALGVEFRYNAGISRLMQTSDGWTAIDENGAVYAAQKVIVATGGLSVPTIGTDGMGHKFLQQLGVKLKQTYPALTPLTGPHPGSENLAGISMHVKIEAKSGSQQGKVMGSSNREGFLFTHKGFSGPAVLDISHLATKAVLGLGERPEMLVNWSGESPEIWKDRINSSKSTAKNLIREHLPKRLAEALCENMKFADKKIAELSRDDRQVLMSTLTAYPLKWSSNEGYRKAEVTGGGVPLEALNTASMELKEYPGLYLCGEIFDVFGRIGGFNFYWAWVTGRIAGLAVR